MTEFIEVNSVEKTFKSFNETFPHCAFALAISQLYPNRYNYRTKYIIFTIITVINALCYYWFGMYLYKCLITLDMYNLSRNVTIGILAGLFFFKWFYVVCFKTDIFADLLQHITDDLLKGNDMEEDYQEIYKHYIKLGKMGQTCWIIIPIVLTSQFPLYAAGRMIYESLTRDDGKRYMIHEMELKYIEDKQYDTPYFECMFAYNFFQCICLSANFAGFDGSFCIATTHMCLKLKLITKKVSKGFKDAKNRFELEYIIKDAIRDHQSALEFYNNLQEVYGGWLFTVFLVTSLAISMNLLSIYLGDAIDPKYAIFAISGVIHMFTPCYYASNLVKSGEQMVEDIYSADWEIWADPVVTKLLVLLMMKSQKSLLLTGKGMVYYNMQLFISILQTSYSFFTLISS